MGDIIDREIEDMFRLRLRRAREELDPVRAVREFLVVNRHLDNLQTIFQEELGKLQKTLPAGEPSAEARQRAADALDRLEPGLSALLPKS
jgi:hypothetical protein